MARDWEDRINPPSKAEERLMRLEFGLLLLGWFAAGAFVVTVLLK